MFLRSVWYPIVQLCAWYTVTERSWIEVKVDVHDQEHRAQLATSTFTAIVHLLTVIKMGLKTRIQQIWLGLPPSFPIKYLLPAHNFGKYYTFCVQIVWVLDCANWHEVPWKSTTYTSILWSRHCIKLSSTSTASIQRIWYKYAYKTPVEVIKRKGGQFSSLPNMS